MLNSKTIRIWHGCKVIDVITATESGFSSSGSVGGAHDSTKVDIEIDPWAGFIVDHSTQHSPVDFRNPLVE